jgi:hypothetical protein
MNFQEIIKKGKYYNPAHSHYNKESNIVCDKCQTNNLHICIGYKEWDLCLSCVDSYSTKSHDKVSYMLPNMYNKDKKTNPDIVTLMAPNMYNKDKKTNPDIVTFMAPDMFNKKLVTRMEHPIYNDHNNNSSYPHKIDMPSNNMVTMMCPSMFNTFDKNIGIRLIKLYDDPTFDKTTNSVVKKIGTSYWVEYINYILQNNYLSKIDINCVYAIKRLFANPLNKLFNTTEFTDSCEARIATNSNAIVYKINEDKTGFTLTKNNNVICDMIFDENYGSFNVYKTKTKSNYVSLMVPRMYNKKM